MGKGAKNDNSTDDTAAIQSAITAGCALSAGATIYFPPGAGYKTANTSTTPFNITCNNLTFMGAAYPGITDSPTLPPSTIYGPALTVAMFSVGGAGTRFGIKFINLGIRGPCFVDPCVSFPNSIGISFAATVNNWVLEHNFFDQWGSSAVVTGAGSAAYMIDNYAQNCLLGRPSVDTGCFDLSNADVVAISNFATTSSSVSGIGNGHSWGWVVRGFNASYTNNFAEISQHGWLVTGGLNKFIGNRAFLNQGNGYKVTGNDNVFVGNTSPNNSQSSNGGFSAWSISGARNNFDDNSGLCNPSNGNGNLMLNMFDDSNSNGAGDSIGNSYGNNRYNTACFVAAFIPYNMTGTSPYRIQHPRRMEVQTQTSGSLTLTCGLNGDTQYFNTALTGAITLTLATSGAFNGCRFRLVRGPNATPGGTNITVNGGALTGLTNNNQFTDLEFLGGAWANAANGPITGNPGLVAVVNVANNFTAAQQFNAITNGTGLQIFNTTTSCTTAATAFVTCTTAAISLPVAEADTSYRIVCTPHGPTNFPILVGTTISSATQFTITIEATTAAAATFSSYDCVAGHN